ncbi:beta-1,3-galactosyltransferase GALT1-like [Primulina tabacum]|uniref:beta-1,3-galactosyltransferase GALT1-like n=1 Tax=Primulina tabacum TaxID=48773 RepID=UPI003F5AC5AD
MLTFHLFHISSIKARNQFLKVLNLKEMKTWRSGTLNIFLLLLFVIGCFVVKNPIKKGFFHVPPNFNTTHPLDWEIPGPSPARFNPENTSQGIPDEAISSDLIFAQSILSNEEQSSLQAWRRFTRFTVHDQFLPKASEAVKAGVIAWQKLMISVENEKRENNGSLPEKVWKVKQCPRFLSSMTASEVQENGFKLHVPCGLTQGSSITFISIPSGNFQVELIGEQLPGEPDPPIILQYNVTFHRDNISEDLVISQNTWIVAHGWGEEEHCTSAIQENITKVDELDRCDKLWGNDYNHTIRTNQNNGSTNTSMVYDGEPRKHFPFKQNDLVVATVRIGSEGIHMMVDGNHVTSFAFHEALEPWLVGKIRISGDVNVISMVASDLPTLDFLEHTTDMNALKPVTLPPQTELNLFIGVLSTPNNLRRRMAVRRTWMQYPAVRSGKVAVRFFVGLNKNHTVNKELWDEAQTFEDIQLMPFVDNYSLITWKTIAICIYGTDVVSAKFIMKTDDDSFVRVDEVLNTLDRINVTHGLLYGLIYSNLEPHREPASKWYTTLEEWPDDKYPPWASGPGYVVSKDIAEAVSKKHREGQLKMFKLEDVAMGIWILDMKNKGLQVRYEKDDRIFYDCKDGYVVAHRQSPGELLCLWKKIQEKNLAICCSN